MKKKWLRPFRIVSYSLIVSLVLLAYFGQHLSPNIWIGFYFLSLGVLPLQVLLLGTTLLAGIKKRWIWVGVMGIVQLLGIYNYGKWYVFPHRKAELPAQTIKVLTYNVKNFELSTEKILTQIAQEKPDVVCLQEFWEYDHYYNSTYNYPFPLEKLQEKANLPFAFFSPSMHSEFGLAILSKYPITEKKRLKIPSSAGVNGIIYANIRFPKQTVRVYNVHLQSMNLSYNPEHPKEIGKITFNNANKRSYLWTQLSKTARVRSIQLDSLTQSIKKSTFPVMVLGDLNSTPHTHVYTQVNRLLQDNFRAKGRGFGYTFTKLPLRLDYIFTHKSFKVYRCEAKATPYSDHKYVVSIMDMPVP